MALQTGWAMPLVMKRTEPSPKQALTPPLCLLRAAAHWLPSLRLRTQLSRSGWLGGMRSSQYIIVSGVVELGVVRVVKRLPPGPVNMVAPRPSRLLPAGAELLGGSWASVYGSTSLNMTVLEAPSVMATILVPLPEPSRAIAGHLVTGTSPKMPPLLPPPYTAAAPNVSPPQQPT